MADPERFPIIYCFETGKFLSLPSYDASCGRYSTAALIVPDHGVYCALMARGDPADPSIWPRVVRKLTAGAEFSRHS